MRAYEIPRAQMIEQLGCTDLDLKAALARLDRCSDMHVDYQQLMEEA